MRRTWLLWLGSGTIVLGAVACVQPPAGPALPESSSATDPGLTAAARPRGQEDLEKQLEQARLELQVLRLQAAQDRLSARAAEGRARGELERARRLAEHFDSVEVPLRRDQAELEVREAEHLVNAAQARLQAQALLEAGRSPGPLVEAVRHEVDVAERLLDLQQRRRADLQSFTVPQERHELQQLVANAEVALQLAQLEEQRIQAQQDLVLQTLLKHIHFLEAALGERKIDSVDHEEDEGDSEETDQGEADKEAGEAAASE